MVALQRTVMDIYQGANRAATHVLAQIPTGHSPWAPLRFGFLPLGHCHYAFGLNVLSISDLRGKRTKPFASLAEIQESLYGA